MVLSSKKITKENLFFQPRKIKIKIISLGGGGNSIISEIAKDFKNLNFFAFDIDSRSLKKLSSKIKTFFLEPRWAELNFKEKGDLESAPKNFSFFKERVKKIFQDADLIILISCLGGRASSFFLPFFSQILNQEKKLSLGIFILPFSFEDERKISLAQNSLKQFKENFSGIIVLENDKILKQVEKNTPLQKSFSLLNEFLSSYLQEFLEILSECGLINIDFADLQTILRGRGQDIFFSQGEGQGSNRTEEALKKLFENPFLAPPLKVKKILFNIKSGFDLTLKEVEKIGQEIFNLNPQAKIIFGVSQTSKFEKKIKIIFLEAGEVENKDKLKRQRQKEKSKLETKEEILPITPKKTVEIKKKKKLIKEEKQKRDEKKKKKFRIQRFSALQVKKREEKKKENIKIENEKENNKWEIPTFLRNI